MITETTYFMGGFTILWLLWVFLLYRDYEYSDALDILRFILAIWIVFLLGVILIVFVE